MRRLLRRGALLGATAGIAYAVWRFVASRTPATDGPTYVPQPFPMPPRPVAPSPPSSAPTAPPVPSGEGIDAAPEGGRSAVAPDAEGNCPLAYPIKGKLSTGIYHPPGAFAYDRTRADRCYRDEAAAKSDGLRAAKR